eukprot:TRINITY_DN1943_c0_g1_i1.p1 TRINITY_DN1943_c0_g1~~TRINITY_DN1943_c0_g1_i1.p1  ORF type:complete len:1543 (+),score=505.58 TRINITY_DN1943_c0_g1_i1:91-4719(+)
MASPIIDFIREAFLFLFNLVIDVICFAFFLASFAAPWRIPWILMSVGGGSRGEMRMFAFAQFGCTMLDFITFPMAAVTVVTWRSFHMLGEVCDKDTRSWDDREFRYNHKIRFAFAQYFFVMLTDIPFLLMSVLATAMVWRAPKFWMRMCKRMADSPKPWHKTDCRKLIAQEFAKGIVDIFAVPFGILILLSVYRVRLLLQDLKDIEQEEEDEHTRIIKQKFAFARHAGLVLLDSFFAALGLIGALTVVRIPSMIREWRAIDPSDSDMAWDRRKMLALQPLLGVRDLLALLGLAVLLATVYRGVLAVTSVLEKCRDQADPRPHVVVTSCDVELPRKGMKLHLKGVKTPDLTVTKASLFLRSDSFWTTVSQCFGSLATAGKMMLPYRLVPGVLTPADFKSGSTEVSTTLDFDIAAARDTIIGGLHKLGPSTVIPIRIEFNDGAGTLFDLPLQAGDVLAHIDSSRPIPLHLQPSTGTVSGTTTAALIASSKKVAGEPFFDVLWSVVLVQVGYLLADFIALVLFFALHLVPWRALTMYLRVRESEQTKKCRAAVEGADTFLAWMRKRGAVVERTFFGVDRRVKNREVSLPEGRRSSFSQSSWRYSYGHWAQVRDFWTTTSEKDRDVLHIKDHMLSLRSASAALDSAGQTHAGDVVRQIAVNELRLLSTYCRTAYTRACYAAGAGAGRALEFYDQFSFLDDMARLFTVTQAELAGGISDSELARRLQAEEEAAAYPHSIQDDGRSSSSPPQPAVAPAPADAPQSVHVEGVDDVYGELQAEQRRAVELNRTCTQVIRESGQQCQRSITCAGRCHGGGGWAQAREAIYREVLEFGYDVAAVISVIIVACTLYRTYTLVSTMRESRNRRKTALWNLSQIGVDFYYLLQFLAVVCALRHALHMPVDLVGWTLERRTFKAARQVIQFYFHFVISDLLQMINFIFAWRTFKMSLACAVFGVFAPAFLLDHLVLHGEGGKASTVCLLLVGTTILWGAPFLVTYVMAADGTATGGLGLVYGIVGVLVLASLLSAAGGRDDRMTSVDFVHMSHVRANWFNIAQYFYLLLEVLVPVAAVFRAPPLMQHASDLQSASQYLLLDFGHSWVSGHAGFGFWCAVAVVCSWYLVGSLPVIAGGILPEFFGDEYDAGKNLHWVFAMGLLGRGLALVVLWNLASLLACPTGSELAAEGCWEGTHQKLGLVSLLCSVFYITTTCAKLPVYSDKKCEVLDIRFVELYDSVVYTLLSAAVILAAFLSQGADSSDAGGLKACAGVVTATSLLVILWTAAYPRMMKVNHVCSVAAFTYWRVAGHAAVVAAGVAALLGYSNNQEDSKTPFIVLVAGAALAVVAGVAASIWVRTRRVPMTEAVTPEMLHRQLTRLADTLQRNDALSPDFRVEPWKRSVCSAVRASRLALQTMKLEDAVKLCNLKTVSLGQRPSWYRKCWQLVDPSDEQGDFERHILSWGDAALEVYCDCFCDCSPRSGPRRDRPKMEDRKLVELEELIQALANGVAMWPGAARGAPEAATDDAPGVLLRKPATKSTSPSGVVRRTPSLSEE